MKTKHAENHNRKRYPCLWMQAGVVRRKYCEQEFECMKCSYDKDMKRAADENRKIIQSGGIPKGKNRNIISWKDKMRALPPAKSPCIHHMKGKIHFKACMNYYNCGKCEFDQFFNDEYTVHAVVKPVDIMEIESFKLPHGYYFHNGHAWAKIEDASEVRIGLDDFVLRIIGPLDMIEAPLIGKEVRQNEPAISIKRGSNNAKVLSPVCGIVTAVNPNLRQNAGLANKHPYSDGWIMRVHSDTLRKDLKNLTLGTENAAPLENEINRIYQVIEETAGPLAADGGNLGDDIYGNLPQTGWERLTKLLLKS